MNNKTAKKLIKKSLNRVITPEEEAVLMTWYDRFEATEYTAGLDQEAKAELEEAMFDAIKKQTARKRQTWFWPAAAVAVVALAISVVLLQSQKPLLLQTAFGEIKTVVLPDSSEVVLNGNSSITYGQRERELWLDGEAFFRITKKTNDQRFMVHLADTLSIEVLGTEFNVQKREQGTFITLKSGKIRLYRDHRNGSREIIDMEPNDVVYIGRQTDGGIERTKEKSLEERLAWRQHKMVLENTPLSEVIQVLKETYGIHVTAPTDAILQRSATGSIPTATDQPIQLMKNIAELYGLTLTVHANQISTMEKTQHSFSLNAR